MLRVRFLTRKTVLPSEDLLLASSFLLLLLGDPERDLDLSFSFFFLSSFLGDLDRLLELELLEDDGDRDLAITAMNFLRLKEEKR